MVGGEKQYTVPMNVHGKELADYAIQRIEEGLEEAGLITIEQSLGHAVLKGEMTASEAYDCLDAYQRAFLPPDAD